MNNLKFKTIGNSNSIVELPAKDLADYIQENIGGYKANEKQVYHTTQSFVDQFEIYAKYASGTFMGFKVSESAYDEFMEFKKR